MFSYAVMSGCLQEKSRQAETKMQVSSIFEWSNEAHSVLADLQLAIELLCSPGVSLLDLLCMHFSLSPNFTNAPQCTGNGKAAGGIAAAER